MISEAKFKSDLTKVVSSDYIRPALNLIRFQNGYAYATDAHSLVKQSLEWIGFRKEEIDLLNNKSLSVEGFNYIKKALFFEVMDDGILCSMGKKNDVYTTNILVKYDSQDLNFPDYEAVIPYDKKGAIEKIALGKTYLKNLLDAMKFEINPIFEFEAANKAVAVYCPVIGKQNQMGVIMPCIIND
jgi:DNA polymerase III sliding clamp (beta) subunit (PCNA family)